ncbi:amidase domain-containing protein [Emergencia sp. 1XD21-10]|uniref:amidase domain-containing protein n=1 Tax=Emergencia sp. 1XD21-10 TaxID=2304569 RepID=UPI00137AE86C
MLIILRAESYNSPAYESYLKDCTNFVSQCLVAGGKNMVKPSNYKDLGSMYGTTSYWYSMHWTEISPYHRYAVCKCRRLFYILENSRRVGYYRTFQITAPVKS